MLDPELIAYIEREIIPRYHAFDAGHQADHVRTVIDEALRLAACCEVDERIAYVAAAYHDLGLESGRAFHHLRSGEIIAADENLSRWFSPEERLVIRQAAEDHRASAEREPRTIYGRIVAEADRIIHPEVVLRRTVQYSLKNHPELDAEGHFERCRRHLLEKYGEGGYLRCWLKESDNQKRLEELRQIIRDEALLRRQFDRLLAEEALKG